LHGDTVSSGLISPSDGRGNIVTREVRKSRSVVVSDPAWKSGRNLAMAFCPRGQAYENSPKKRKGLQLALEPLNGQGIAGYVPEP